jgi:2-haloacid dehalogenase
MRDFETFEALSFDCYGTLVDWESGILEAVRPILRRHGVAIEDEPLLELYGGLETELESGPYQSYRTVLGAVMEGLGKKLGFQPSAEEQDGLARALPHWKPFPDTVDALGALKKRYRLIILSNIDDDLFAATARVLRVPFDEVITAQQVRSYKPGPAHFREALARTGLPGSKILHVAQSLFHDVPPARALGFGTVWIDRRRGRSGAGATPLSAARPDLTLPDLASLVARMGLG